MFFYFILYNEKFQDFCQDFKCWWIAKLFSISPVCKQVVCSNCSIDNKQHMLPVNHYSATNWVYKLSDIRYKPNLIRLFQICSAWQRTIKIVCLRRSVQDERLQLCLIMTYSNWCTEKREKSFCMLRCKQTNQQTSINKKSRCNAFV